MNERDEFYEYSRQHQPAFKIAMMDPLASLFCYTFIYNSHAKLQQILKNEEIQLKKVVDITKKDYSPSLHCLL